MKKFYALISIGLLIASSTLFGAPLAAILEKAEEYSTTVKAANLTYESNKMSIASQNTEDGVSYEVSSGNVTVADTVGSTSLLLSASPSVSVTLPNDGKTKLTASLDYSINADGSKSVYSPAVGISHNMDFGYSDENQKAYQTSYNTIQTDTAYLSTMNSFRANIIEQIKTILQLELTIKQSEKNVADMEKNISNKLELGTYSNISPLYKKDLLDLNKAKSSLAGYKEQYSAMLTRYETSVGSAWDGVEDIGVADINFTALDEGNSQVELSSIKVKLAEEELKLLASSQNPNTLALSSSLSLKNGSAINGSVTAGVGATYKVGDFSISSSVNGTYTKNKFYPSLSFALTWKNNNQTDKDDISLKQKENSLLISRNDYLQKLLDYSDSADSLYQEILSYNFEVEEALANSEYLKDVLENQRELYELGLATKTDVENAEFNLELDEINKQVLQLKGLSLQLKIEAINI